MASVENQVSVACLECDRPIRLPFAPDFGQIVTCPSCQAQFEVIGLDPLELDFHFEDWEEESEEEWDEDEDWEEDDDWDDEEDEDWE